MDRSITVCALTDYTGQKKAWKYNQLTIKIHYSTILFAMQNINEGCLVEYSILYSIILTTLRSA